MCIRDRGKGTSTIYYLQTGWSNPGTPNSGTDETPGSWTTTVPTFAVGKSVWFTIGTKPAGSSTWTFTYPQLYLGDLTYSVPGVLDDYLNTNVIIGEGNTSTMNSTSAAVGSIFYNTETNALYEMK